MNKVLRVLHLEDDPDYSDLVKEMLEREGLRVEKVLVDNYADFIAALEKNGFDVILGDYSLPACNGLQALQIARQKCPDTPFLLISGVIGEQAAVESLKCGAADYVLKQWPERLVPAVQRAVREVEERAQRRQAEEALRASERNYQEIFNATNEAILVHDAATGAILDVNQTMLDMFGYSRDELLNLNGDKLRAGGAFSHQEAVRRIRQAAAEGPQVFEWQSKRKNGELFWSEVALRGARIGGQGRVLAAVRDITHRKNAEGALAESRGLRKAILVMGAPEISRRNSVCPGMG